MEPALPPALPLISAARAATEAVLLVLDNPATIAALAASVGVAEEDMAEILAEIEAEYAARGSGIELRETAAGWRLYTRKDYASTVEQMVLGGSHSNLSRAALETLAIVAYQQPISRSKIAAIRGVNVDGVVRTLLLRGLLAEVGTEQISGAHLYGTTELLLEQLGIESLEQLPPLAPLLSQVEDIAERA